MPHVLPAVGVPQKHGMIPQNSGYYYTNGRGRNLWSTSPFNINAPSSSAATTTSYLQNPALWTQQQQQKNAALLASNAAANPAMGPTVSPTNPTSNAATLAYNQSAANNPFSVDQFKAMYAQNPAMAMRMYGMDNQAGGRNAINSAMNWSPSQANSIINQYGPGGGSGFNPNQGFTPSGQAYSLAPGSQVNMGALQKLLATGSSKTYANAGAVPGLTMYGSQFNPQSGSYMANINSNVNTPGANTASTGGMTNYTGFGNSMIKGPAPAGPTNLPPNSGTAPYPGSSNYVPGNSTTTGTTMAAATGGPPPPGGPPTVGINGSPTIGPPPAPTNMQKPASSSDLYAGNNVTMQNLR